MFDITGGVGGHIGFSARRNLIDVIEGPAPVNKKLGPAPVNRNKRYGAGACLC